MVNANRCAARKIRRLIRAFGRGAQYGSKIFFITDGLWDESWERAYLLRYLAAEQAAKDLRDGWKAWIAQNGSGTGDGAGAAPSAVPAAGVTSRMRSDWAGALCMCLRKCFRLRASFENSIKPTRTQGTDLSGRKIHHILHIYAKNMPENM